MTITDEAIYDMIANGVTTTLTGDIEIDTGLPERLRAALTAALEGREEPDAPAAKTITHERAREAASRLIAGSFRRDGERLADDKRPRFSIPTRIEKDDDTVIVTYIEQQQRLASDIARIRAEAVEEERERCARVAETRTQNHAARNVWTKTRGQPISLGLAREEEARDIAAAIRGGAND